MPFTPMADIGDKKSDLLNRIGDVSHIRPTANYVLVAIYNRHKQTKSGIYMPDSVQQEDQFQGKSGLILAMGPQAFEDSPNYKFEETDRRSVGDWVAFKASDGMPLDLNHRDGHFRMFADQDIRAHIDDPEKVW